MAETLKERSELDPEFMWDLSSLYKDDAAWEQALNAIDEKTAAVAAFAGKLTTADSIRSCFAAETELSRALSGLFVYANLRHSEDTRAEAAQSMYQRAYSKYVEAGTECAFIQPEILGLPDERIKALTESPELADYKFTMEQLLTRKPHTLSASEEKLLAGFGESLGAPGEVADSLMDADMVFDDAKDKDGAAHEVTGSNYILLQTSGDRVLRESSFHSFYKGFRQHINTFAATYSADVKTSAAEARARSYPSARAMYMAGEDVPEAVYDNLVSTVREHLPTMYRYVDFRKKMLGLSDLHYYDIYAPLVPDSTQTFTYEQAQDMVLKAVAPLGKQYGDVVRGAFRDHWIDVYPNRGKSGGAYSSGTYDSNPYIMTNFTGTLDSVSTIAHEMGHSMHSWFSNHNQPAHYADYTIFVAEVASTVNENLLIKQLLAETDDPKMRLYLLNQQLENFKGTVYRQTMFAEFERDAHAMVEQGEALTPAALNQLYGSLTADYFGPGLVLDDEVSYEWARIPHFYRDFYVYKYATSYATAMAISEAILTEGQPAVDRYLEFLKMGGSTYPLEELKHAGVDLTTPAPIETAMQKFESVLAEAEEVSKEANNIL